MAGKSGSGERHANRPGCNNRYHYDCADGRPQCERRGKLFRRHPRGRRNEPLEKRGEIARLFRLGVSTVRAAARQAKLDSIVYADVWKAYNKLSLNGFHHKRINHDKTPLNGKVHIKGLENFRGRA